MNKFKFGRLGTLGRNETAPSGPPPLSPHHGAPASGPSLSQAGDDQPRLPEGLAALATNVADSTECLKVIHQRSARDSQQTLASVESQKQLAEALGIYAQRLRIREGHDEVLVRALSELKDLTLYVQGLREEMDRAIHSKFTIPMDEFVRGELREAKVSFKKCEKARSNYGNAIVKVKQLNAKPKLNLVKVVEAEKERDTLEAIYKEQAQDTTKTLADVNAKNQIETLEQLCAHFEEYKKFFSLGYKRIAQLQTAVKEFESVVNGRKQDFRSGGGKVTERVRVSPDTLEFKDIDESRWEKETDQRKIALMQLVEDERLYSALLSSLIENYRDVLIEDETLSKKIERADINAMFADVDRLRDVHNALRVDLEAQLHAYPRAAVGKVFAARAQGLELYPQFVMSGSTREDALERSKNQSSSVRNFLKISEEKDEAPLQVLLSLPAKRVLRYEQFLRRLLNLTDTSDPDYAALNEAIHSLQMLQSSVEQSMEISKQLVQVLMVKNKLQGFDQPLNPLVDRHRRFVREGSLYIFQGNERKPEEHYFFLFNNLLIYSKKISNLLSQLQGDFSYRYVGTVPIQDVTAVRDLPDTEALRNAFEVVWPGQAMILCAPSPERKNEWRLDISAVVQSLAADRLFGIALGELMSTREQDRDVPMIMEKTIGWLAENNANQVEGLFRISGMMTEIQHYRHLCDQGQEWEFPVGIDPHVVSGLLKLWIRELPEPLMTFAFHDAFMATKDLTAISEEEPYVSERISETRKLIGQLPQAHAFALQYLMQFLADVARNSEVNKMNPHNLAIVFGPNLLYKKSGDPFDCSSFKDGYNVIEFLIRHYESLFQDIERKRTSSLGTNNRAARQQIARSNLGSHSSNSKSPRIRPPIESPATSVSTLGSSSSGTKGVDNNRSSGPAPPRVSIRLPGSSVPSQAGQVRPTPPKALPPTPGGTRASAYTGLPAIPPPQLPIATSQLPSASSTSSPTPPRARPLPTIGSALPITEVPGIPSTTQIDSLPRNPSVQILPSHQASSAAAPPLPVIPSSASFQQGAYGAGEATSGGWQPSNVCANCRQPISGKGINALEQRWHTECFVCAHCKLPFQGSYVPYQGKPYCVEDFNRMFGKRCGGCQQPITGSFLQAMGRDWHPEHFVCSHCSGSLAAGFFDAGGRPICQDCSYSLLSAVSPTASE